MTVAAVCRLQNGHSCFHGMIMVNVGPIDCMAIALGGWWRQICIQLALLELSDAATIWR